MAAFGDKDTTVAPKAPVSEQAKAAGTAASAAAGKVQAKTQTEYTKTLSKTKSTIDADIANAKRTVELANKKGTPAEKAAAKDFYNTLLGLKPLLDKLGPEASNIYKGDTSILTGDTAFTSQGKTGVSSSGKYYVDGREVSVQEYGTAVGGGAGGAGGMGGGTAGTTPTTETAGTATDRILAKNTFRSTLALMLGSEEAAKAWVDEIYGIASGFYKSGSTIEEALNFSIYEAKNKGLAPQFTKRFQGVFDLQARLQAGEAIEVPTIAEFIKAESDMGTTLREAGLGDLATQDFLGSVIGKGKSVLEVGNLISQTFATIDNAPKALKDTLSTYYPTVDRVSLAKALLTGEAGAAELNKKVAAISVLSAAGSQGVTVDLATAGDIAARGFNYQESLTGFGQVKELERAGTLAQFQGGQFTQQQAQGYVFEQNQAEKERLQKLKSIEEARFGGSAGLAASALRGKATRGEI